MSAARKKATRKTAAPKKPAPKNPAPKNPAPRKTGKRPVPYRLKHRDGSLWAKGQTIDGVATGFWQWFRKDGSRMRSGYFHNGAQIGEWTTYDKAGRVHKMTEIKGKDSRTRPPR